MKLERILAGSSFIDAENPIRASGIPFAFPTYSLWSICINSVGPSDQDQRKKYELFS
jgi:hypothetical protein